MQFYLTYRFLNAKFMASISFSLLWLLRGEREVIVHNILPYDIMSHTTTNYSYFAAYP